MLQLLAMENAKILFEFKDSGNNPNLTLATPENVRALLESEVIYVKSQRHSSMQLLPVVSSSVSLKALTLDDRIDGQGKLLVATMPCLIWNNNDLQTSTRHRSRFGLFLIKRPTLLLKVKARPIICDGAWKCTIPFLGVYCCQRQRISLTSDDDSAEEEHLMQHFLLIGKDNDYFKTCPRRLLNPLVRRRLCLAQIFTTTHSGAMDKHVELQPFRDGRRYQGASRSNF
jgi:hypothetical protein